MNACPQEILRVAMRECVAHAKSALYRGVNDIADAMPGASREAVYKWVQTGRIPLVMVPAFEAACGASFVSRALAELSGYLLVKAPVAGVGQLGLARVNCQVAQGMLDAAVAIVDPTQAQQAVRSISLAIDGLASIRHSCAKVAL